MPSLPPVIGSSFIELNQVESTNNYATALVHEGLAQHGMVVFAYSQTKGKGQRNKQWISEEGKNLTFTIIVQPKFSLSEAFYLSMATANAVAETFQKYSGTEAFIKWPNDIYVHDRKAGGILVENVLTGSSWKWAVIGIGLNINQEDFGELRAISLIQDTNKEVAPIEVGREICKALESNIDLDKHDILEKYHRHLYKKDELVRLKQGSRVFEAVVKRVEPNGDLVAEHAVEERFKVGDIEWLFPF